MSTEQDRPTIEAMLTYGGGFASQLAAAWLRGDEINRGRIKQAFPELFDQYATVAGMTVEAEA